MSISMYQASIPVFLRGLDNLAHVLDLGATHAKEKNIEPSVLLNARLFPDMFALTRQVQIATDMVKGAGARLAGIEIPAYADDETSFDELKARIAKTQAFLRSLTPAQIDGTEDKTVDVQTHTRLLRFKAWAYVQEFALPNFYFHITTAYDILRHNGVAVGKRDYLGALPEVPKA